MKIKAFEAKVMPIKNGNYSQYNREGYTELFFYIDNKSNRLNYSKDGSVGISLEQAQQMLKVLGIELYEDKEINTFEEFSYFLFEHNLSFSSTNGNEMKLLSIAKYDRDRSTLGYWLTGEEVESRYNVKLNILKNRS